MGGVSEHASGGVRFFCRAAVDWVWINVEGGGKLGSKFLALGA